MRSFLIFLLLIISYQPSTPLLAEMQGNTILDVSARLSRDLKGRVQEHLNKIFGFGKSEVFIQVDVGFSPTVRGDLERTLKSYLSGEATRSEAATQAPAQGAYQWLFPGLSQGEGGPTESFILPGFSLQQGAPQAPSGALQGPGRPTTPFSDPNFLYAIGLEVKRIFVKVALDYSLNNDAEAKVQALVGALLDLDPKRGDKLIITRFNMPNPIFELFKEPQFLSVVLKWLTIASLILVGLALVAVITIFLIRTLVGQLERWVEVFSLMRHRTMEVKFDLPPKLQEAFPAIRIEKQERVEQREESKLLGGEVAPETKELKTEELRNLVIDIPKEKIFELAHLIGKEQPGHIALVVAKLPQETRNGFLARLPTSQRNQVLAALASPQYIEPGLLMRLKNELEKRVAGVVGGEEEMVKTLEAASLLMRMTILKNLEQDNQLLFKAVRKKILLFDDLLNFTEQELSHLLSRVSIHDLSLAIADGIVTQELKEKILCSLPKKTAETLEELLSISGKPPQEKIFEAQDKIIHIAQKMIAEGSLRHPLREVVLP